MTRRSLVAPAGIVVATVIAATVVLVAGSPDGRAFALVLLVGVPLLLALGAGSDQGWQAMTRLEGPASLRSRLVSLLPVILIEVTVVVLLVRQVVTSVADGEVVCAVELVPLAMLFVWRGWQFSRRLRGY
jgi:hypothetical protein